MRDCFWFDNVCSGDAGIRLQGPVQFSGAEPRVNTITIPGRNGDLHTGEGAFKNRTGRAECFALQRDVSLALDQMNRWAFLTSGYRRLETPEEPDHYRLARISGGPETAVRMRLLAPFTIRFDCMPQKFLKRGDFPIRLNAPAKLYNDGFPARPYIKVYGTGPGTLTVGNTVVQIKALEDYLELDCDLQDAFKGSENKNNTIYAPEFPVLAPGESGITWTGGINHIEIKPRWWTL